jgi:galactose oxidase
MAKVRVSPSNLITHLTEETVFIVGGQSFAVPFSDDTSQYTPELWDPTTQAFTQMAPQAAPRNYHSIAILLPDATVFNGGGGLCGSCTTNHRDGQIFSPPYLFTSTGALATRPVISSVSATTVKVGSTLTVTTGSAVTSFSLIRYASTTHTVNTDQRRIPLTPTASSGTTYTLQLPTDNGILVPGPYMVFALNAAGVPSVSKTVLVTN